MINSHVKRWVIICVALVAASPLAAQTTSPGSGSPVDLSAPPGVLQPAAPSATGQSETQNPTTSGPRRLVPSRSSAPEPTQTVQPERLPGTPGKTGIEVDGLSKIDTESVGVLTRKDGGFGIDMWQGVTRTNAVNMINAMPHRSGSAALREISALLLLSRARAPVAVGEGSPSLLSARARALLATGDVDNAELFLAAAVANQSSSTRSKTLRLYMLRSAGLPRLSCLPVLQRPKTRLFCIAWR